MGRPFFSVRTPEKWLFVTGCYNSGTTILRDLLGAHPAVATLPMEGDRLTGAYSDLEGGGWQRMWHLSAEADAARSVADPEARAQQAVGDWNPWWARGAQVFLEKSISHGNRMPVLAAGFPEARFIFVIRNGFCVSEGILRRARPVGAAARQLGRDHYLPAEAARQWVASNEAYLRDRAALPHLLEFRYDDFAANPMGAVRDVLDYLDLPDAPLQDLGGGRLAMGKREFHIRDENAASIARLSPEQHAEIAEVIDPMMETLGLSDGTGTP